MQSEIYYYGNGESFAVKFYYSQLMCDIWMNGYVFLLINNYCIGNKDTLISLRDVMYSFEHILSEKGHHYHSYFSSCTTEELIVILHNSLFGNTTDHKNNEKMYAEEWGRLIIHLPVEGVLYLIEGDNRDRLVAVLGGSLVKEVYLPSGAFYTTINEAYLELNKTYLKLLSAHKD